MFLGGPPLVGPYIRDDRRRSKQKERGAFRLKGLNATEHLEVLIKRAALWHRMDALLRQTRPPDEILVIDDGSSDNSTQLASRLPVRVIRHDKQVSLRRVTLRFCMQRTLWSERLTRMCCRSPIGSSIFSPISPIPRLWVLVDDLIEAHHSRPADAWRATHMTQDLGTERIDIKYPSHKRLGGFGTIFRKEAVLGVGGYNENYSTNYEDVDLCARLLKAGHKLIFEPRAVAFHQRQRFYWFCCPYFLALGFLFALF